MRNIALALGLGFFPACSSLSNDRQEVRLQGTLVVLDKGDARARLIDVESARTITTLPTGNGPHEVAVSKDGRTAVVADYGDKTPGHTLTVIDLEHAKVARTIDLSPHKRPHGIAFLDGNERVLVTSETSRSVLEVDLASGSVKRALETEADVSHMLALHSDERVFTANIGSGTVSAIDLSSGTCKVSERTGNKPEAIAITPDGREVWVGHNDDGKLVVLDARTLEERATVPCGPLPIRIQITPDGKTALVSCAASGELAFVDVASRKETARIALPKLDAPDPNAPPNWPEGNPVPVGILIEPSGRHAFVALAAAKRVALIDLEKRSVATTFDTGNGPDGLGWAADG